MIDSKDNFTSFLQICSTYYNLHATINIYKLIDETSLFLTLSFITFISSAMLAFYRGPKLFKFLKTRT